MQRLWILAIPLALYAVLILTSRPKAQLVTGTTAAAGAAASTATVQATVGIIGNGSSASPLALATPMAVSLFGTTGAPQFAELGVGVAADATTGDALLSNFLNIGSAAPTAKKGSIFVGPDGTSTVGAWMGESSATNFPCIQFSLAATQPAIGTCSLYGDATNTYVNANTGGTVFTRINNATVESVTATTHTLSAGVTLALSSSSLQFGTAVATPAAAATAIISNTGGAGPATALQNGWAAIKLSDGSTGFLPVWK